jgi:hypothetical protein
VQEQFTEFGIRLTLPGYNPRDTSYQRSEQDAIRAYDHAAALHGEAAVEFLMRQVRRTDWVATKLPPPVKRDDGPLCDPTLRPTPTITDAGSVDTYEEAR